MASIQGIIPDPRAFLQRKNAAWRHYKKFYVSRVVEKFKFIIIFKTARIKKIRN